MAAGRSVSYELYYLQHGRWSIHARYSYRERDTSIEEAKSLEKQGHIEATCVVRESFDYSTNRSSESVIYHSPSLKAKPPVSFITSGAATGERKKPATPSVNFPPGSAAANAAKGTKSRGVKKAQTRKEVPASAASEPPVPHPPLPAPPESEVVAEGDYSAILPKLILAFIIASVIATVSATLLFYLIKVIVKLGIAVDPGLGQGILIGSWALVWGGIFIPMTKRAFDLVKLENRRIQMKRRRRIAEHRAAEEAAARVLAGDGDDAGEGTDGARKAEDIGPGADEIVYAPASPTSGQTISDDAISPAAVSGETPSDGVADIGIKGKGSVDPSVTAAGPSAGPTAGPTAEPMAGPLVGTAKTAMPDGVVPAPGAPSITGGEAAHRQKALDAGKDRADSLALSNDPNAVEPISGGADGLREELQVLAGEARDILRERLDSDAFQRFGVILFLSGAGETLARRCRVRQAEMRTILTEIVQGFSIPESQARGFTHNVDEYLLDRRYFAMYSAGREGAMRSGRDDPSGMKQALEDWRNAARQRALRAAGSVATSGAGTDPDQSFVAVKFTEIVDSTTRQQELGDVWMMNVIRAHNEIGREVLKKYAGREIKHTGDGIMATFAVVANAVEAALAMQAGFARVSERGPDVAFAVRIGLSAGEPIHESGDVFGTPVNLAARVLSHAVDGDTAVSAIAREMCRGKGLQFEEIGRFELKGFDEPQPIYRTTEKRSLPIDLEFGAIDRVVKDVEAAEAAEAAKSSEAVTSAPIVERSIPGESESPSLLRDENASSPPVQEPSKTAARTAAKTSAGRRKRPAPGTVRKVATSPAPPRVPRSNPGYTQDDREAESTPAEIEGEEVAPSSSSAPAPSSSPGGTRVTRISGGQSEG